MPILTDTINIGINTETDASINTPLLLNTYCIAGKIGKLGKLSMIHQTKIFIINIPWPIYYFAKHFCHLSNFPPVKHSCYMVTRVYIAVIELFITIKYI